MSLFDDLLTKVQSSSSSDSTGSSGSGSSTGWSGQQDPLGKTNGQITISQSTPIITNQEIRMTPVEPPVIVSAPVEAPVITITEAPMIGTDPIQEESLVVNTPSIQIESIPEDSSSLFEMTTSPTEESKNEDSNNFMLTWEETNAFMQDWFSKNEVSENLLGEDTLSSSSPLFDMSDDSSTSNMISSEWELPKEDTKTEDNVYRISSSETSYRNTKEYLKHAFEEVEVLIATIDLENENKIKERESYRVQKEHFAELELQAEWEHQKMLEERAHAKRMKTYLEHEQAKSELPPSIKKAETTKKVTQITQTKSKVTRSRVHAANHTSFAQVA
jgi:hypothetical protein